MKRKFLERFLLVILCTCLALAPAPQDLYAAENEAADLEEVQEESKAGEETAVDEEAPGREEPQEEGGQENTEPGQDLPGEDGAEDEEAPEEKEKEAEGDPSEDFRMTLPTVYLHIDGGQSEVEKMNGSEDHSYRCTGTLDITVPEGFSYTDGGSALSDISGLKMEYIRGRGNSTWSYDKKPYKIKLAKKTSLLGMGSNKHWALLANALDPSMMRNRITLWLGRQLGLSYTPSGYPVDVFMEGEYLGSYLLCEVVRVDDNRVEIDELDASDTSYPDITGGYLIQNQQDYGTPAAFKTEKGEQLQNAEPSFDPDDDGYENEAQKNYIRNYLQEAEDSIFERETRDEEDPDGWRSLDYRDYFDLDSAAIYWLVQEFSKNADAYNTGSTYFYKTRDSRDKAGKIFYGPLWDFDYAWDKQEAADDSDGLGTFATADPWMTALMTDRSEKGLSSRVRDNWPRFRSLVQRIIEDGGVLDRYSEEIRDSWTFSNRVYPAVDVEDRPVSFEEAVESLRSWIVRRIRYFDEHIGELDSFACRLSYRISPEDMHPVVNCCRKGDPIFKVPDAPEKEGFFFTGWFNEDGENVFDLGGASGDMVFTARYVSEDEAVRVSKIYFRRREAYARLSDEMYSVQCTLLPEDALIRDLTWESSDPSVAETAGGGVVFLNHEGTAVITAHLPNGSSDSFTLHVVQDLKPLADAAPERNPIYLLAGETTQAALNVHPADADYSVRVSWEEDDIADIDYNLVVTGKKPGRTIRQITVSYEDGQEEKELILDQEIIVSDKEGTLTTDVVTDGMEGTCPELEEKGLRLLSPQDLESMKGGANALLRLEMTGIKKDKAPAADRKALDAYLKEKKLQAGLWMDLSLFKKVGEVEAQLHETAEPLSFTVTVPSSLQNAEKDVTRTFSLLRIHDGKVSELSSSADLVLKGKSSEFSTYLLAYSDKKNGKKEDGKEDQGKDKGKDKGKGKDKKRSGPSAETGDESNAGLYLLLGGAALICAGGALWFGFRKKKR